MDIGWSLRDIDETDCESLISFVLHLTKNNKKSGAPGIRRAYADEVSFL
jgi:hypothetical protein